VTPAATARLSPEEFLAWERDQAERHVYARGDVFAMAGGSPRHSALAARTIARITAGLRDGECNVYTSDLRLGLSEDQFVYADAVVCGPMTLQPGTTDVVTNPTVIVEVLSRSTEAYDRGEKQAAYLALPSVRELVLVAQREPRVEVYSRREDGSFRFVVYGLGGAVRLETLDVTLDVDGLYAGVFDLPGE